MRRNAFNPAFLAGRHAGQVGQRNADFNPEVIRVIKEWIASPKLESKVAKFLVDVFLEVVKW